MQQILMLGRDNKKIPMYNKDIKGLAVLKGGAHILKCNSILISLLIEEKR